MQLQWWPLFPAYWLKGNPLGQNSLMMLQRQGIWQVASWEISVNTVWPKCCYFPIAIISFHGLMNSINWPASSVRIFIPQLVEYCSASEEAMGSNPVEAPKTIFFPTILQLLKLQFTGMVTYSFHLYSRSSHNFLLCNLSSQTQFTRSILHKAIHLIEDKTR